MRSDALLAFVPLGSALSLVGAAGVGIPSSVVDLLGLGVGQPPTNQIIGNAAVFGEDPGIGGFRPELMIAVGIQATTATAATLTVQLQYAVDVGAPTYLPGPWVTIAEQPGITAAQLSPGQVIARFPFLPAFPANLNPRYVRLNFQPAAATDFTAGTIAFALVTLVRDDQANKFAAKNFTVR